MDIITCTHRVGVQILYKVNYVLCLYSTLTKKCSIANSDTKFCDYTIIGVTKGALGPCSASEPSPESFQ